MTAYLRSALFYRDPRAALAWLEAAFGFELFMLLETADGEIVHSEMRFGDGAIMVGSEWSADHQSPVSVSWLTARRQNHEMLSRVFFASPQDFDAPAPKAFKKSLFENFK